MKNNNYKFGKSYRLHLKRDFNNIIKNGKKIEDMFLRLYFLPNEKNNSRFATVINKKFGKAVERNKAKRIVREFFRYAKCEFNNNYDIICYLKPEFKNLDFEKKKTFSIVY